MNSSQFAKLSSDLRILAKIIPLNWGNVQNNKWDSLINMFEFDDYEAFEREIYCLDEIKKNYFRRRWFAWRCAKCDEYLFTINDGATPNPNQKDQTYDVMFHKSLCFDIKGTVIPQSLRGNIPYILDDPQNMIEFFYTKQSKGVRNCFQNRLFIVHHSFVDPDRQFYLRCAWETKRKIYEFFVKNFHEIRFRYYKDCAVGIIYLFEQQKKVISCIIDGYNNNKPIQL